MKILIVDDSKIAREMLKKTLKSLGYDDFEEAVDGEDGFNKYKQYKPDLVLSDIEMPKMDGFEGLKLIKEYDNDAYVVIISSVANTQVLQQTISSGAKNIVRKPLNGKKLQDIVEKMKRDKGIE